MKRFWKDVAIVPQDCGWGIALDGRPMRTPHRAPLIVASAMLAEAIAAEWEGQGEQIDLLRLHLTRLANVAIDRTPDVRDGMADEVARLFCETDVLTQGLFTMAGHEDGVVAFGATVAIAAERLISCYASALKRGGRPN